MSEKYEWIILETSDKTFNPFYTPEDRSKYSIRKATRGLLTRGDTITLEYIKRDDYYKYREEELILMKLSKKHL